MTSFFLIPWARTTWCDEGRLAATTGLPLNQAGLEELEQCAASLQKEKITLLCSSTNETGVATAKNIAKRLGAVSKTIEDLSEPTLGVWEGLTPDDLAKRYPKAYKQWLERPTTVCPPEGEDVEHAAARLHEAIQKLAAKYPNKAIGLVLGPIAKAIMRCHLENIDLDRLWEKVDEQPTCYRIDLALDPVDTADRMNAHGR